MRDFGELGRRINFQTAQSCLRLFLCNISRGDGESPDYFQSEMGAWICYFNTQIVDVVFHSIDTNLS